MVVRLYVTVPGGRAMPVPTWLKIKLSFRSRFIGRRIRGVGRNSTKASAASSGNTLIPTPDIKFSLGETKSRFIGASFDHHELNMTVKCLCEDAAGGQSNLNDAI